MVSTLIFSMVVVVFVLHTILTHLFNWMFRSMENFLLLPAIFHFIEFLAILVYLRYILNIN